MRPSAEYFGSADPAGRLTLKLGGRSPERQPLEGDNARHGLETTLEFTATSISSSAGLTCQHQHAKPMVRRTVPNAHHCFDQDGAGRPLARVVHSGSTGGKAGEDSAVHRSDTAHIRYSTVDTNAKYD